MKTLKKLVAKTSILLLFLGLATSIWAQAPEKMSYQAIIRDASNVVVASQTVGMKISILSGSATGTAVYVETHSASTNVNGLVTIEIGTGSVVSGTFAAVDWSSNSFFIKTETDPTGGTSYSISGTSQMLSVPYALHAKSADETDPVFTGSLAGAITPSDTGRWASDNDGQQLSRNGDTIFISKGNYILLPGYSYLLSQIPSVQQRLNNGETPMEIYQSNSHPNLLDSLYGKTYQGGYICYLDVNTGEGLIASLSDLSAGHKWQNPAQGTVLTYATGTAIGTGKANTDSIIKYQGSGNYCAWLCYNYSGGGYTDWYLPSSEELKTMWLNLDLKNIGSFDRNYFASSSEVSQTKVKTRIFRYGTTYPNDITIDKDNWLSVRAVRYFGN